MAAGIAGLRQPWLPSEVPEASRDLVFQLGDAMASAMEKDYKEATQKFEAVLQQYPQEANVHFRFGAFLNIQDSARGVEEIRKAVELAPDHVPALVGLTVMYLKREEIDMALEYGERAVKASPEDFSTHIALGRALLAKENPAARPRSWKWRSSWRPPVRRRTSAWLPPIRGWAAKKMRRGNLRNSSGWNTWGNSTDESRRSS